jgi:6,7-dimethyl-8-ribityllumazine synthase
MSKNFVIIVGSFHEKEAKEMVRAASETIENAGHLIADIVWIPGSYEAPIALKREFMKDNVDGAVVLGIIERGETAHGRVMGDSVSLKILDIQLEYMKPVGMGILGPEIMPDQIPPRVVPYAIAAAEAAIKMME